MNNIFEVGTNVRVECIVKLHDGTPHNPTNLKFLILVPGSTVTEVDYISPEPDTNNAIKHQIDGSNNPIVGAYYIDWATTVPGNYKFMFQASGDVVVSKSASFEIKAWP